jgi:RNA polymerase sigma-70 factor (ECF subfamily)
MGDRSAAGALVADALPTTSSDRLAALFEAHSDRLYRLARRLTPTRDEARDLVQETFLRAAAAPTLVPSGHRDEESWLVRVLVNIQRDQ